MEAIDLVPVIEVRNFSRSDFVNGAWYDHDNDPNQNTKYILKHLAFINNLNRSPLPERGLVVKNVSSGALLLDSNDSGSYFAFKSNKLDSAYIKMLQYYYKNKCNIDFRLNDDNYVTSFRISISKYDNGYSVFIK